MADTPNLHIPLIEQNEVNGHVTIQTGSQITDLHGQSIVEALTTVEPGSPAEGQAWIINGTPTGTNWGTDASANQVAHFYGGIWNYYTPNEGWRFYNKGDTLIWKWDGIAWSVYVAGDIPPNNTIRVNQGYVTPLLLTSTADTWVDVIIPSFGQIGSDFSYNNTTGELTYTGQPCVAGLGMTFLVNGAGVSNGEDFAFRLYHVTKAEALVLDKKYATSPNVDDVTFSGTNLDGLDPSDVLKIQFNASNTSSFNVYGGWYSNVMYFG